MFDRGITAVLYSPRKGARKMPTPASIQKAQYDKANCRRYNIKLNNRTDADIIARIEQQGSFQAYIKRLIREDIARNGGSQAEIPDA